MQKDIKKTEKLASALYLLTSFFGDLEPMKWRLRDLGGKLVAVRENRVIIEEIISLLNVAKNVGLVSEMNHQIINKEFTNLLDKEINVEDIMKLPEVVESVLAKTETKEAPKIERLEDTKTSYLPEVPEVLNRHLQETVRPLKDIRTNNTHRDQGEGAVALKKNGRQTTIFSLLRKKGEIMIKDVSPMIPGVSEKTIQRELLSMVKQGVLKKEGEKRWSRYSLA